MVDSERLSSEYSRNFLAEETGRCVSCGLCLPHCPTYRLLNSEADSPRGRIAMMSGVVNGRIPVNEKFIQHLDRCLTCRACESVCPNDVAYGQLIDEARKMIRAVDSEQIEQGSAETWNQTVLSFLEKWVAQPKRLSRLRWPLFLFQRSGLHRFLRWLSQYSFLNRSGMGRMLKQLPPIVFPDPGRQSRFLNTDWQTFYPAAGEEKGKIGLFLGCVARLTDATTLNASIFVLNHLGYSVSIPAEQVCCGALQQHAGDAHKATQLMQCNKQAFSELQLQYIISTASGCGVQLTEYPYHESRETLNSGDGGLFPQVLDISKFLVAAEGWDKIQIKPLAKKIAVHDPCSLRNVLGGQDDPRRLMQYIPNVQMVSLAGNDQCCGAAGIYFIKQPELADRLLDAKINAIIQSGAQILLTSNVGCSMHLAGRLRETGSTVEVLHPVTLLARQMGMR